VDIGLIQFQSYQNLSEIIKHQYNTILIFRTIFLPHRHKLHCRTFVSY